MRPPRLARRRHLVGKLHALGPAPLAHFLDDIERGGDVEATLERYAALPLHFVRANRGAEFPESMLAIQGGRAP